MARINIEECWWSDPRRDFLRRLLKVEIQDQVVVHAWRLAQEHWEKGRLIPGYVFVTMHGYYELLQANLAQMHESADPKSNKIPTPIQHIHVTHQQDTNTYPTHANIIQQAYIYVRGSCEYLSWGYEIRQKRALAGQKSALRPRDSRGRLLKRSTELQQITNSAPTSTNIVQHSGSVSGSGSGSSSRSRSKDLNLIGLSELERIYELYPRRNGTQRKADGIRACESKLKTPEQVHDFEKAVTNYAQHVRANGKEGTEFVSQFKTFTGNVWKEWINPDPKLLEAPKVLGNGMHPVTKAQAITQNNDEVFRNYAAKHGLNEGSNDGPLEN